MKRPLTVSGGLVLRRGDVLHLRDDRLRLLERIEELGSIARAARAVGISYKTAWEAVEAMNRLSERPLVQRSAGGRRGGGTVLTEEGRATVRTFRVLEREHQRFLQRIGERIGDIERYIAFARRISMRVSARNVYRGTVANVRKGAVNTEATISLPGGETLCSVITNESSEELGLARGQEVCAFFKASAVLLGRDLHAVRTSARNVLCGTVDRVRPGAVNTEVTVTLRGRTALTAIITAESAKGLAFRKGDHACALVKASSVLLGVAD